MDKELIIFVCYINVDGQSRQQAEQRLYELIQLHKEDYSKVEDKEIITHWFPVLNQETRIECIYPVINSSNVGIVENGLLLFYKSLIDNKYNNNDEIKTAIIHLERKLKLKTIIDKNENN